MTATGAPRHEITTAATGRNRAAVKATKCVCDYGEKCGKIKQNLRGCRMTPRAFDDFDDQRLAVLSRLSALLRRQRTGTVAVQSQELRAAARDLFQSGAAGIVDIRSDGPIDHLTLHQPRRRRRAA